jgi:serine O-acetyltransferase
MSEAAPVREVGLLAQLREDLRASGGGWLTPGFHAVAIHRIAQRLKLLPRPLRTLLRPLYGAAYLWVRNVYGIELPASAKVGRRLWIAHQGGIVVNPRTEIGDDCLLRHNVTIGVVGDGRRTSPAGAPRLGNDVEVGAGAVIVGEVTIGDGVRIGPNAVVMTDIPAGGSAFASPARVLKPLVARERSGRDQGPASKDRT